MNINKTEGNHMNNKDKLIINFTSRVNSMKKTYPDLCNYDLTGNKLGNELYKSDPKKYEVLFNQNPVIKFDKYSRVISALTNAVESEVISVLKSFNLYSYVQKIQANDKKRKYTHAK